VIEEDSLVSREGIGCVREHSAPGDERPAGKHGWRGKIGWAWYERRLTDTRLDRTRWRCPAAGSKMGLDRFSWFYKKKIDKIS
jgi:hypothetical protein